MLREKTALIRQISVGSLWDSDKLNGLVFHPALSSTSHTSRSSPAVLVERPFRLVHFEPSLANREVASATLADLRGRGALDYSTERSISQFIKNFIEDGAFIAGLDRVLMVADEAALIDYAPDSVSRAYTMIIKLGAFFVMAVEVKCPRKDPAASVVSDPDVAGQLYDYLLGIQSMFGTRPLGIISDGRFWRICWLPSEDDIAAASSLEEVLAAGPGEPCIATERHLFTSSVMDIWQTSALMRVIVSTLLKVSAAQQRQVSIFGSHSRLFASFDDTSREWRVLPPGAADRALFINMPRARARFYALASRCTQGKLTFMATDGWGALFVVKVFLCTRRHATTAEAVRDTAVAKPQEEKLAWEKAWDVSPVAAPVGGDPALLLPFVVTLVPAVTPAGLEVHRFPSSPAELLQVITGGAYGHSEQDEPSVSRLFETLMEAGLSEHTPESALRSAVASLADRRLVHPDIEWRHVGLLLRHSGSPIARPILVPVLIDLEGLVEAPSAAEATATMNAAIRERL